MFAPVVAKTSISIFAVTPEALPKKFVFCSSKYTEKGTDTIIKNIDNFFKHLNDKDIFLDKQHFYKVDEIIDNYKLQVDSRIREIYYMILKLSMLLNKRTEPNNEDYDLIRYFLENINRRVLTSEIKKYELLSIHKKI